MTSDNVKPEEATASPKQTQVKNSFENVIKRPASSCTDVEGDSCSTTPKRPRVETNDQESTEDGTKVDSSSVDEDKVDKSNEDNDKEQHAEDGDKSSTENNNGSPLDLAVTLGYKPGDRLEVEWEVENDGNVTTRWWGATLEAHDGRTEDSVAIRVLDYDPYPDGGFDERSREDVIFMGNDLLVSPDSQNQMNFRREGDTEPVVWYNEGGLNDQLNTILMGALNKHNRAWNGLAPAQQAAIAEKIANKKEKLMEALRDQKSVITSSGIKDILQQAFR